MKDSLEVFQCFIGLMFLQKLIFGPSLENLQMIITGSLNKLKVVQSMTLEQHFGETFDLGFRFYLKNSNYLSNT